MKKIYLSVLILLVTGCGTIVPAGQNEVSPEILSYIKTEKIEKNYYRVHLCQGKSYFKKPGGSISESWVQAKNIQVNIFDNNLKIVTFNYDESIVLDFSKEKLISYDLVSQSSKLKSGSIELNKLDPFFLNNKVFFINKRINQVMDWIELPMYPYNPGRFIFIYEIETSASNNFCENKRIIFYKKFE